MKISTERSREIKGDVGHLTRRAEQAHEDPEQARPILHGAHHPKHPDHPKDPKVNVADRLVLTWGVGGCKVVGGRAPW